MQVAPPIAFAPAPAGVELRPTAAGGSLRALRLLRMARHLTVAQLAARAHFMLLRRAYARAPRLPITAARRAAAGTRAVRSLPALPRQLLAPDVDAVAQRAAQLSERRFAYLGREADYSAGIRWHDPDASPLWTFNLHYLGAVLDLALTDRAAAARQVLAAWSDEFGERWDAVAWHPYPVSLRLANLCFAAGHLGGFDALGAGTCELIAAHAVYLLRHLEHDLRGNHLFENAFALLVAAAYLDGPLAARSAAAARRLFRVEIAEQVRADGSHFENSPMYHVIVLVRCLQALALLDGADALARDTIAPAVRRMAAFLAGILCPDGDIPPLGDAVRGFAPPALAVLALAERLTGVGTGVETAGVTSFADAGLHVFRSARLWAIFDAGPVCPDYLPGHGQADSLTVEVWCDGACLVGDPGVHEYTGPERAWGRSSRAHSTITIDDADTSEVYDSFRVGGRARILAVRPAPHAVTAALEPFGVRGRMTRSVHLQGEHLEIVDSASVPSGRSLRSRLHLHPAVQLVEPLGANPRTVIARSPAGLVRIEAAQPLQMERGRASRRYGLIEPTTILVQPLAAGAAKFSIVPLDGAA